MPPNEPIYTRDPLPPARTIRDILSGLILTLTCVPLACSFLFLAMLNSHEVTSYLLVLIAIGFSICGLMLVLVVRRW